MQESQFRNFKVFICPKENVGLGALNLAQHYCTTPGEWKWVGAREGRKEGEESFGSEEGEEGICG